MGVGEENDMAVRARIMGRERLREVKEGEFLSFLEDFEPDAVGSGSLGAKKESLAAR
jgi:hypothetical protein